MYNVASRYAQALLQLAVEQNSWERIQEDMHLLQKQCAANPSLLHALRSPIIKREKKMIVLERIFERQVHPLVLRLFVIVTKQRRAKLLPAIAREFLKQCDQLQGIVKAQVATTFPLPEQLATQFKQAVQQIVPARQVQLDHQLDPTLIGGYILRVGDKQLDQSLRGKLYTLKKHYMTEGY